MRPVPGGEIFMKHGYVGGMSHSRERRCRMTAGLPPHGGHQGQRSAIGVYCKVSLLITLVAWS